MGMSSPVHEHHSTIVVSQRPLYVTNFPCMIYVHITHITTNTCLFLLFFCEEDAKLLHPSAVLKQPLMRGNTVCNFCC